MGVKEKPDIIDIIEKKRLQLYGQVKKDARGENTKTNYGLDTTGREGREDAQEKRGWKEYKQP